MIKFLVVTAIIFVSTKADEILSKDDIAKLKKMHEDCKKESGADDAVLKAAAVNGEYADDAKLKEHLFCCAKKLEFQNDKGELQPEIITKKLVERFKNQKIVETAVKQCSEAKDTPQETAMGLVKCLHQFVPPDLDIAGYLY